MTQPGPQRDCKLDFLYLVYSLSQQAKGVSMDIKKCQAAHSMTLFGIHSLVNSSATDAWREGECDEHTSDQAAYVREEGDIRVG